MATSSVAANPHAALAARRGIFVRRRLSAKGADSSRCRIPAPSITAFNRDSFRSPRTGAARRPLRIYRRPPTSRAHRLEKPDRASELLTFSVARWARGGGLLTRTSAAPRRAASRPRRLPLQGRRGRTLSQHARSAVAAVGLGRRRPADQNAFRRFDSSFAARAGGVALVVHARCLAPHPVVRREPWLAPSRAGRSPRAIPLGPGPSRDGGVAPRERCVSPTSATDSRNEHPADCPIPGRTPRRASPCGDS